MKPGDAVLYGRVILVSLTVNLSCYYVLFALCKQALVLALLLYLLFVMTSFRGTTVCHAGCLTSCVQGVSLPSTDKASYSNIKEQLQVE